MTEKPVELVFDVTPDRTYLAVIDEDFLIQRILLR
ncbi:hypothetical protein [Bacillus thuringiensis]